MWKDQKQCYWTKIKESTGLHFSRGSYHRLCKILTLSTFFSRFLSSYDSSCASIVTCILTLDFLPLLIRLYWAPIYKQGYSPIARALITFANCFFPCKVKHSLVSVRTWISLGKWQQEQWVGIVVSDVPPSWAGPCDANPSPVPTLWLHIWRVGAQGGSWTPLPGNLDVLASPCHWPQLPREMNPRNSSSFLNLV